MGGRRQAIQPSQIGVVDVARLVAAVESQLLLDRQASHPPARDGARGEASRRIAEEAAVEVGLAAVARLVEGHRVKVYLAARIRRGQGVQPAMHLQSAHVPGTDHVAA